MPMHMAAYYGWILMALVAAYYGWILMALSMVLVQQMGCFTGNGSSNVLKEGWIKPVEAKSKEWRKWYKNLLRNTSCNEDANKCFACGKLEARRKICTGCNQIVVYCDKSCQKEHWKVAHKQICLKKSATASKPFDFITRNIGKNPSQETMHAAALEFHRKVALGIGGADNPMPVFTDENGETRFL
jgi:hypothetical protein